MNNENFNKLKKLYTEIIEIVCKTEEPNNMNMQIDLLLTTFYKVEESLNFLPYTHFYTQVSVNIIVKTYNTKIFRSDLLLKFQISCFIGNEKYYPNNALIYSRN